MIKFFVLFNHSDCNFKEASNKVTGTTPSRNPNQQQDLINIKMERFEGTSFLSEDQLVDQQGEDSMIEMNYDNEDESENELANNAPAQDGYDSIAGNRKKVTVCAENTFGRVKSLGQALFGRLFGKPIFNFTGVFN